MSDTERNRFASTATEAEYGLFHRILLFLRVAMIDPYNPNVPRRIPPTE